MIYDEYAIPKEKVYKLYVKEEFSIADCAKKIGTSIRCFKKAMKLHNIKARNKYAKSKGKTRKLKNNPNLGSKTQEYHDRIKQMKTLPKNEIKRRKKISESLRGNTNIGSKTQEYFDNIKKTGKIPKNEIIRRKKIRKAMKERKVTWGNKIGKALIGNKNSLGNVHSEKTRKQISKNTKKSIQEKIKKEGYHWGMKGKKHTKESNKKNSKSHPPEKSNFYIDGRSYKEYTKKYYKMGKIIRKRDKHKCKLCGENKKLVVHHIDENKKNNKADNLITLCRKCHMGYHGTNNIEIKNFYIEKMKEKIKK